MSGFFFTMKILIEGDSWGVGCWAGYDNKIYHPGLTQYLNEEGYSVDNWSTGGKRIYELLNQPINEYDYIFVFLPDPLRGFDEEAFRLINTYRGVLNTVIDIQKKYFDIWNNLNKKIHIIGCGFKAEKSIIQNYQNLEIVVPSMIEYLYPDFIHPPLQPGPWVNWIDSRFSLHDIDKFISGKNEHERTTSKEFKKYFAPDGYHMNHLAHKQLFEYIQNNIFNIKRSSREV